MKLDFGKWYADLPEYQNPGALLVKNCMPLATSYRSIQALEAFSAALDDIALGWFWIKAKNGSIWNFAGDQSKLYLFDGTATYDDVSKAATTYAATQWDFVAFQERVLATDGGASPIQKFDVGTPSLTFDTLAGSPPLCKCLGVVRDFVLAGNYELGSEIEPGGYAWSGFNNTELWTPSMTTQSGRQRGRGQGGALQRIVSGSEGVLLREFAVQSISYIGPPQIWRTDDIAVNHGTPAGQSACWTAKKVFYFSTEGFKELDRASRSIKDIGNTKVDEFFLGLAAPADLRNIRGTIDRRNNVVWWAFRSSQSSPAYNRVLLYYWPGEQWAIVEMDSELIMEFVSPGYTLDTIGAVLGGTIDSASILVDDPTYLGGGITLAGFDAAHQAATFSGTSLIAEIDTTEWSSEEAHKRSLVNGVRPLIEGSPSTVVEVAPITRDQIDENPALGAYHPKNTATGICDMRTNARFQRYRVKIAGGFKHARGVTLREKGRGRQ